LATKRGFLNFNALYTGYVRLPGDACQDLLRQGYPSQFKNVVDLGIGAGQLDNVVVFHNEARRISTGLRCERRYPPVANNGALFSLNILISYRPDDKIIRRLAELCLGFSQ
jgi:hypothetical protein